MIIVGAHGRYEWLVTDVEFDLLEACPEVVINKYVAVTSIDSGILEPTDQALAAGWQFRQNVAYSPKIQNIDDLPRGGWDEWYIFENPTEIGTSHIRKNIFEVPHEQGHVSVFVNYNFTLAASELKPLADLFWPQISWIQPQSFVADGGYYLNFVTMDKTLFANVCKAVDRFDRE